MKIKIARLKLRKTKGKINFNDQLKELKVTKEVAKSMDEHILATLQKQQKNEEKKGKENESIKK